MTNELTMDELIGQLSLIPKMQERIKELEKSLARSRHELWMIDQNSPRLNLIQIIGIVSECDEYEFSVKQGVTEFVVSGKNSFSVGNLVSVCGKARLRHREYEEAHIEIDPYNFERIDVITSLSVGDSENG